MFKAILGEKLEQSQRFTADGERLPVTLISAGPCPVVSLKKNSLELGFGERKIKNTSKAILGQIKKVEIEKIPRFFREIRLERPLDQEESQKLKVGQIIKVGEVFAPGDKIQVTGKSWGKGFAGVVKRWGFAGGPRTHGQSDRERAPGSIGSTTTPGRVYKGKKMAGRMGGKRVTLKGLEVVEVDNEKNLLIIKGLVPGKRKSLLIIQKMKT